MEARAGFVSDTAILVSPVGAGKMDAICIALEAFMREHPWVMNFHPAYESVLIDVDLAFNNPQSALAETQKLLKSLRETAGASEEKRILEIPVRYGGEFGPDLVLVTQMTGFTAEEVVERHTKPIYEVAFLGFSPGFPYLRGMDPLLKCQRRESPRIRVPEGSVAIGGAQTGIYPEATPGGWQIIGRTHLELFNPRRAHQPSLLSAGDRIRFVCESIYVP